MDDVQEKANGSPQLTAQSTPTGGSPTAQSSPPVDSPRNPKAVAVFGGSDVQLEQFRTGQEKKYRFSPFEKPTAQVPPTSPLASTGGSPKSSQA